MPSMEITQETEADGDLVDQQQFQHAKSVAEDVTLSIEELKLQNTHQQEVPHVKLLYDKISKLHKSYMPSIFRVPNNVRDVNPQCYIPRLVSIGPFHRDNPQLKLNKSLKIRLVDKFLCRKPTSPQKSKQMGLLVAHYESIIRTHYPPNEIKLNSKKFCFMILVDATFIVELLVMIGEGDPMTENRSLYRNLLNDILLIENQIPLFVIYEIYSNFYKEDDLLSEHRWKKKSFFNHIHKFIKKVKNPISIETNSSFMPEREPVHFIDYLRQAYVIGESNTEDIITSLSVKPEQAKGKQQVLEESQPSGQNRKPGQNMLPPEKKNWKFDLVTASRLRQYGVQFKVGTTTSLKDINFNSKEGILKLNKVIVNASTENLFRNIVAYEQYNKLISTTYVSDYLIFMDSLIDTPEDVNILTDAGIIQNDLHDPEKVSQMFNTLHKEVITEGRDYLFAAQSDELSHYGRITLHRWKAKWYNWKSILKRDYFNSPWATLAFITAAMLVGLTIVQTICSVYQARMIKMP